MGGSPDSSDFPLDVGGARIVSDMHMPKTCIEGQIWRSKS